MRIADLAESYAGDAAWERFAEAYNASGSDARSVAAAILGTQSAEWLQSPMAALDGSSPNAVLALHDLGDLAIRALLMRLP